MMALAVDYRFICNVSLMCVSSALGRWENSKHLATDLHLCLKFS